jgi:hypothetical protein
MLVLKEIPRDLDSFEGDLVVTVVGLDERPPKACNAWLDWRLYGTLSSLLVTGYFEGKLGEKCLLPTYGKFKFDRLVLIGGGHLFQSEEAPVAQWVEILEHIRLTTESLRVERLGLCFPRFTVSESEKNLLKAVQDSHLPFQTSVFVSRNAGRAAVL